MDADQEQIKRQEERSILINFVLDKSGSMEAIREATIAGFNQFLRDQQQEGGSAAMTLTLFDAHFNTVVSGLPLARGPAARPSHLRPGRHDRPLRRHRPHDDASPTSTWPPTRPTRCCS